MLPWGEEQGAFLTLPFVSCKDAWWENAGRSQHTLGSYATTISLDVLHHAPAHSGQDVTSGTGRHWATTCTGQQGATSTDDSRTKTGIRTQQLIKMRPKNSINRACYCYSLLTNPIFWISMPVSANQKNESFWRKLICQNLFFLLWEKREASRHCTWGSPHYYSLNWALSAWSTLLPGHNSVGVDRMHVCGCDSKRERVKVFVAGTSASTQVCLAARGKRIQDSLRQTGP